MKTGCCQRKKKEREKTAHQGKLRVGGGIDVFDLDEFRRYGPAHHYIII
jgi:hypothetical protein